MSERKERGMLFSGEMVKALLAGTKTQTRRPVKLPLIDRNYTGCEIAGCEVNSLLNQGHHELCQYGKVGDVLYVKETFGINPDDGGCVYRATDPDWETGEGWKWKPPVFMPRAASRIDLEIVEIRVERLHDISKADAEAEGIFFTDYGRVCGHHGKWQPVGNCKAPEEIHPQNEGWMWKKTSSPYECLNTARGAYGNLWNSINGKGSWNSNPWVWVITFKRIKP